MGWKFWKKKPEPVQQMVWPTDSYDSVRMLAAMYLAPDLPPFVNWRPPTVQVLPQAARIAEVGSKGLMLALWFWQFSTTHGSLAARMARDAFCLHLNELNQAAEQDIGSAAEQLLDCIDSLAAEFEALPDEKRNIEVNGQKVQVTFHYFFSLTMLVRWEGSPFYGTDVPSETDFDVAECLAYAAEQAQGVWAPMLGQLGPFNASTFRTWLWSPQPGAHERHLQRRHNNPLFARDRQHVTAADVYFARLADAQALAEVRRGLEAVFEEIKKGGLPFDWHPHLNGLREQLDELYEQLQRAGGNDGLENLWRSLREHIIETWRVATDNPDVLARAEALVRENWDSATRWTYQLAGPERTIPLEEIAPSLLCETVEDIAKSAEHMGQTSEALRALRGAALQCVMQALGEGHEVPQHRQKLAALGVSI